MLNNTRIEGAKPGAKAYKLSDEKGLYLLVQPAGRKWWRPKYRLAVARAAEEGGPTQYGYGVNNFLSSEACRLTASLQVLA